MAWASVLTLLGCSDSVSKGALCGAGTIEKDGVCVAVDSQPPRDDDDGPKGEDDGLACGAGTLAVEGECVPSDAPRELRLDGFAITQLTLKSRGRELTGTDDPKLGVHHPIDVSLAVRYEGDPATIPLVLALGEAGEGAEGFCFLGGVAIAHSGRGEVVAQQRVFIPKACLEDNSEDGSGAAVAARSMHPVLLVDPDAVLKRKGALPSAILFSHSEQQRAEAALRAHTEALAQNKMPTPIQPADLSLSLCRGGSDEPGSCAVTIEVEERGVDFELTDIKLESSVLVLNRCFQNQAGLEGYAAETGLPTGYVCNRSIVRGIDDKGEPLPLGNVKDYTYGAADLELDTSVTAFGMEHSSVSADELMQMGSMTPDGFVLNIAPEEIANNALGATGAYSVRYYLRPASVVLEEAADRSLAAALKRHGVDSLVNQKKLLPLYLHEQGEQAKADGESPGGQAQQDLEETIAIAQAPTEYSHGLYVENDCGRFNDPRRDTHRPGTSCASTVNPRDEMLYGDYAEETDFFVVACLTDGEDGVLPDSDDIDNNCLERPIRLARVVPREARWRATNPEADESENPFADDPDDPAAPGFTQDEIFGASDSTGWSKNYDWDNRLGNGDLSLNVHAHTHNSLSLASGASTDNEAKLFLASGTFDFSLDLVRLWAEAAARTMVVGSYYDYGLEFFGQRYMGERKEAEFHKEWDWNITKEWSKEKSLFVKIAWVDVGFKVEGQVGFRIDLDVTSRGLGAGCDSPECSALATLYHDTDTIGEAALTLTPYGSVKARVFAAISIQLARAGAAGEITLVDLGVPAKAALSFGFVGDSKKPTEGELRLATYANLQLKSSFLAGRLYLFAEHRNVKWCDAWLFSYPCGETWSEFWDHTIASWSGWEYNQTLWSSPLHRGTLNRNGLNLTEITLNSSTYYKIQASHSGKCLEAPLDPDSQKVSQTTCHGGASQRWAFVSRGSSTYVVVNQKTKKALEVGSVNNKAQVYSRPRSILDLNLAQWVQLTQRGDAYTFKFRSTSLLFNRCVDVEASSLAESANVQQANCSNGNNQLFRLIP